MFIAYRLDYNTIASAGAIALANVLPEIGQLSQLGLVYFYCTVLLLHC